MIGVFAIACLGGGCGMLKPPKHEVAEQAAVAGRRLPEKVGEALNVRLVPGGSTDPDLPDPGFDLKSERQRDPVVASGPEIELKANIFLPDPVKGGEAAKPLYFVWDENALGIPLKKAVWDHRLENEKNTLTGSVHRDLAKFEANQRRWYVPLAEIYGGREPGDHPGLKHLLTLDLDLADGSRVLLTIRFRAVGPLPRFTVTSQAGAGLLSTAALERHREGGRKGLLLHRMEIANPVARPFKLWVRAPAAHGASAMTVLHHHSVAYPYGLELPPVEGDEWKIVAFPLPRSVILFEGADRAAEQVSDGNWVSFDLLPSERVTVKWFAKPTALPECALPAPVSKVVTAYFPIGCGEPGATTWGFGGGGGGCIKHESRTFVDAWKVESSDWGSEAWSAEVRVGDPWQSSGEAQGVGGVASPARTSRAGGSALPASYLAYGCQGVF